MLKKSQCTPLFMAAYTMRGENYLVSPLTASPDTFFASMFLYNLIPSFSNSLNFFPSTLFPYPSLPLTFSPSLSLTGAGAVIHTHSKAAVMATLLYSGKEFRITHQEMIKGIRRGQTKTNFR